MSEENMRCGGHAGRVTLPVRKRLDHRGSIALDVTAAWYFITICAADHEPWVGSRVPRDREDPPVVPRDREDPPVVPRDREDPPVVPRVPRNPVGSRVPRDREGASMDFTGIADALLSAARWYHQHGKWRLALFLVMPDHLHFIAHFPMQCGHAGRVTLPMVSIVQQYKSYLTRACGLRFQRGFWDTRIRDDAHYAEKFRYICNNPVRKGLCDVAREWSHVIAFDRSSGEERKRRESGGHAGRVTLPGNDEI